MRVSVCLDGRSPRPWLAFQSTKKPGYVGDGRAESN